MRPALKICFWLGPSLLLWSPLIIAQEAATETTPARANGTDEFAEPSQPPAPAPWKTQPTYPAAVPDVYYLPDISGNLRKVLGFRYEDFLEAWQQETATSQVAPPRFVIDSWDVSGKVNETYAQLRVELEITLQTSGWIDIPIQLPKLIVEQLAITDRSGGECLVFDKERHGHVIWLSGETSKKRTVVLEGLAKLALNAGREAIELHLPRATTSEFSLLVPDSPTRFETSPELSVSSAVVDSGQTEVKLLGQANPVQLSWNTARETTSSQAVVVEVDGRTTVRVDRRRVTYDAILRINSFGHPLEHFQVRLPPGARLNATSPSGEYQIVERTQRSGTDDRQLVEVRSSTPRTEPWEVRLRAERPLQSFSGAAECEVGGFEVLDAFPQAGTIVLEVDSSLQAYFDIHGDLDQISVQPPDTTPDTSTFLGQFRYSRFPWQLVVHTAQRQRRVTVKPQYALQLNSEENRLDIQFDYELTGAKIFSLRIDLQGWQLTDSPIDAGSVIDTDRMVETREGQLVMPLLDTNIQRLKLTLSLRKKSALGENTFLLPEPLRALVIDGSLVVGSAQSLQVTPIFDQMRGLGVIADANLDSAEESELSSTETPEELHLRTFLPKPKFVAEIRQREQLITASGQTRVEMDPESIRVRQQINYLVKYRPLSNFLLSLPEQLSNNDSLTITLNGEPVPYEHTQASDFNLTGARQTSERSETLLENLVAISLPRRMQDQIPIEIAYEIPTPELIADQLTPVQLELAVPVEAVEFSHEATISTTGSVLASLNQRSTNDAWNVVADDPTQVNADTSLRLQADDLTSVLPLYALIDAASDQKLSTLESAWIQTWIAKDRRQDRAVFRFRTEYDAVLVQLPASLEGNEIEVLLDGVPQRHETIADTWMSVSMPAEGQSDSHTLELRYQLSYSLPSWGHITAALPSMECRETSTPVYWQLILPQHWHALSAPDQLIPDYWLGWKNYRWGRQPNVSQSDLEQNTGAVSLPPPPPMSSQYVYRAFEAPTNIRCSVIRRVWVLAGGTLLVFGVGLVVLYSSIARNGIFWFTLSLLFLAGVFSYPEVTLLSIQVILLGGAMTFLAYILRRIFAPETRTSAAGMYYPSEASTQLAEPWQDRPDYRLGNPDSTATMHTGGRSS